MQRAQVDENYIEHLNALAVRLDKVQDASLTTPSAAEVVPELEKLKLKAVSRVRGGRPVGGSTRNHYHKRP